MTTNDETTDDERVSVMAKQEEEFADFNKEVDEQLAIPENAAYVAAMSERMREADRAHAMSLAMVRQAAAMTQADLAASLGITQGSIARQEGRSDMLLSSLRSYLRAVGAEMDLLVTLSNGETYSLSVDEIDAEPPAPKPAKAEPARRRGVAKKAVKKVAAPAGGRKQKAAAAG